MASKNSGSKSQNLIQFPNVKRASVVPKSPNRFCDPEGVISSIPDPDDITFGALFDLYFENYAKHHVKTWADLKQNYERYFKMWTNVRCSVIRRRDVQQWFDILGQNVGKHTANRSHDTFKAVFNWGLKKDFITCTNPAIGIDRYKVKPRERFVQPGNEYERLARSIAAYPNETMQDFFWMCIFTGARKTNVMMMRWDQISFELNTWRIPDTKNGDSQTVVLTKPARVLLDFRRSESRSEWVFPSDRRENTHITEPKKAWNRIVKNAGIEDLHIHDLRRTLGSFMAINGVSPTIIGKALGHKSPTSTAIYARLTNQPVRDAMEHALSAMAGTYLAIYEEELLDSAPPPPPPPHGEGDSPDSFFQ